MIRLEGGGHFVTLFFFFLVTLRTFLHGSFVKMLR